MWKKAIAAYWDFINFSTFDLYSLSFIKICNLLISLFVITCTYFLLKNKMLSKHLASKKNPVITVFERASNSHIWFVSSQLLWDHYPANREQVGRV